MVKYALEVCVDNITRRPLAEAHLIVKLKSNPTSVIVSSSGLTVLVDASCYSGKNKRRTTF